MTHPVEKKTSYDDAQLPVPIDKVTLERDPDGQFRASWEGHTTHVRVLACFPWSKPTDYVSLRDEKEREIALIRSMADLDASKRAVVEQALAESAFVLTITKIDVLEEEYEIRHWEVITKQGPRKFQTKRDEWPRQLHTGGLLIRDVAGDLFYIPSPADLDPASQKRLQVYVD